MQKELVNPNFDRHGYVQVYTGDGKGKTTASLGLIVRALGRGWNVMFVMFTKGGNAEKYGELLAFRQLSKEIKNRLTIIQAGCDRIAYSDNINEQDTIFVENGIRNIESAIKTKSYDLIVMDELNIALSLGLVDLDRVLKIIDSKPDNVELVFTGRLAHPKILERAHLISEINPIKHYWDIGIKAREGIEY